MSLYLGWSWPVRCVCVCVFAGSLPELVSMFAVCVCLCAFKRRVWYDSVHVCVWVFLKQRRGVVVVRNETYSFIEGIQWLSVGTDRQTDRWTGSQKGFYRHWGDTEPNRGVQSFKKKVWRERKVPLNFGSASDRPCPCPCLTRVSGCQRSRTMCKPTRTSERNIKVTAPPVSPLQWL